MVSCHSKSRSNSPLQPLHSLIVINLRIRHSKAITKLLELVSQSSTEKKKFGRSIAKVESFISKLQIILLDKDTEDILEKEQYFQLELSRIFQAERNSKIHRRGKQDFYVLWCALSPIGKNMVAHHRIAIKQEIQDIFSTFKTLNLNNLQDSSPDIALEEFKQSLYQFHARYRCQERKLKLDSSQKNEMIAQQNNLDPISGSPIFIGDQVHVDHIKPIALGGKDAFENIQIAHPHSNLSKGAKFDRGARH